MSERLRFNLPDAFTRQRELPADLAQRVLALETDSEAHADDLLLGGRKSAQHAAGLGLNVGIDQTLGPSFRMNATYTYRRGLHMLRGRNLNAPAGGVRPDRLSANVIDVVGDAGSRTHALNLGASLVMLSWHQTFFAANYAISSTQTNTTGAFSLPANGDDLSTEWGQTVPRHRFGGSFNTQPIRNLTVNVNA